MRWSFASESVVGNLKCGSPNSVLGFRLIEKIRKQLEMD